MKPKLLSALAATLFFVPSLSLGAGYFNDVNSEDPGYLAIQYLKESGLVQGYADGTFKPDNESNRGETLKLLLLGSRIQVPEVGTADIFPDVTQDAWYAKYVLEAKKRQIVQGNPDGLFYPGNSTNLAEFLKMLLETNDIEVQAPGSNPYADVPAGSWYAPYFEKARELNLLDQLRSENVYPAQAMTRRDMAKIIYRLMTGYHEGVASYYGNGADGAGTASGEKLNNEGYVAAHKRLPFNSWVKVMNLENGQSVNVRIIDRGPYSDGRVIDLSRAAFQDLAPLSAGLARVSVLPISDPQLACAEDSGLIAKNGFNSIVLDNDLRAAYLQGEELVIAGQVTLPVSQVSGFLVNSAQEQLVYSSPVHEGRFEIRMPLPKAGEFQIGLIPGESGQSSIYSLKVLSGSCLKSGMDENTNAPQHFTLDHKQGHLVLNWEKGNFNLLRLVFSQNGVQKEFFTSKPGFIPPYHAFSDFESGEVKVTLQGAVTTDGTLAGKEAVVWSLPNTTHFYATTHQSFTVDEEELSPIELPETFSAESTVTLKADPLIDIAQEAWITYPNGFSAPVKLTSSDATAKENEKDWMVFPAETNELKMSFTPNGKGVHRVEWNTAQGIAALNLPLYFEGVYPLLPNPKDFPQPTVIDLGGNLSSLQQQFLALVNADRMSYGVNSLTLDASLNQLAQARADDMAENNYFSHWNLKGETVMDLRERFGIKQAVSENLAKESTLTLAQYGLMQSASHGVNLLDAQWTRAGFGIAKNKDGGYTFVQVFSAEPVDLNDLDGLRSKILDRVNAKRTSPYTLNSTLNDQSQQWSERMVNEDFFAFTAANGDTLVDQLRAAGVENTLGTYIAGNTNFEGLLNQITSNAEIQSGSWEEIGIGLSQDKFGVIKATVVYTE